MTTQEMIDLLERGACEADECYPNRTMQGSAYREIAARLKSLEDMRERLLRAAYEAVDLEDRSPLVGAILDTAREVEK